MKIIQLMPEFGLAGAEIMTENLIYGLTNAGQEIFPVSFYNQQTAITKRLEKYGLHIEYLNKEPGFDISVLYKFRQLLFRIKPNIVHSHRYVLPYAFLSSMWKSVRIVHTIHNIAIKEVSPFQQYLQWALFRNHKITPVAISPLVKQSVLQRYNLSSDRIPVIYNGIDLKKCLSKKNYALHDGGKILHIGRFSSQKNHFRLLDAFEKVHQKFPTVHLQLIGNGELKQDIYRYAETKKLIKYIDFLGLQSNVYPFLQAADIFVLSSDYEGMPITLIEAMATGLPIVSTNVGGISDMITNDKNGLLVETSSTALAKAIMYYLNNEQLRMLHGLAAQKSSSLFTMEKMTQHYLEIYCEQYKKI